MIRHNPNNDHASKNELARSYYKTSEDIITIRYHLLNIIFLRVSILIIVTSPILIQHNPYKNQASFAQVIDPIYSHASYFGKSIGLNKRTVPINRTVSSKWHQRVHGLFELTISSYVQDKVQPKARHQCLQGADIVC